MHSQNGIVHLKALTGRYEVPPPAPGMEDTTSLHRISQMRLHCCGSPLPTATLGNVDDVGPSRRGPLRACCRFWTANLLMSESGTSTGPLPLFCHLTSPDSTVRGPHRGVAPLLLTLGSQSPAARVHPDLLCPCFCHHPRLCTLSLQSPLRPLCAMDSAQLSLQGTFFLPVTASRQEEPAPKTSRGSIDTTATPSPTM